jgi:hypothetical protein
MIGFESSRFLKPGSLMNTFSKNLSRHTIRIVENMSTKQELIVSMIASLNFKIQVKFA